MLSYIKWLGMMLGGFRFGAGGAIVGFFVGYVVEELLKGNISFYGTKEAFPKENEVPSFSQYQTNLMMLIAATLRADGYISKEKIRYTKLYVFQNFGGKLGDWMMKQLNILIQNPVNVGYYAEELRYATNREAKVKIMQMLFGLTIQNGRLDLKERMLLQDISVKIGMLYTDFENIINSGANKQTARNATSAKDAYSVLKLTATASNDEIKKTYRKLVLQFHPDRLPNATNKDNAYFNEIQQAYEKLKVIRNIK